MSERRFETTGTYSQQRASAFMREAYYRQTMRNYQIASAAVTVLILLLCLLTPHVLLGLLFGVLFSAAVAALLLLAVGPNTARMMAENLFPDDDAACSETTWFAEDGVHRIDDEGDEACYAYASIRYSTEQDDLLLLSARGNAAIPVFMAELSKTDRESLILLLQQRCPKRKSVDMK